jgi:hypothetical protein
LHCHSVIRVLLHLLRIEALAPVLQHLRPCCSTRVRIAALVPVLHFALAPVLKHLHPHCSTCTVLQHLHNVAALAQCCSTCAVSSICSTCARVAAHAPVLQHLLSCCSTCVSKSPPRAAALSKAELCASVLSNVLMLVSIWNGPG